MKLFCKVWAFLLLRKVLAHLVLYFSLELPLSKLVFCVFVRKFENLFGFRLFVEFCLFLLKITYAKLKLGTFLHLLLEIFQCSYVLDILDHLAYTFSQGFDFESLCIERFVFWIFFTFLWFELVGVSFGEWGDLGFFLKLKEDFIFHGFGRGHFGVC